MEDEVIDRSMPARFQRHIAKAVSEFLEAETGFEPYGSMLQTTNMDFHHYQQSWRYHGISLGIQIEVTVVD